MIDTCIDDIYTQMHDICHMYTYKCMIFTGQFAIVKGEFYRFYGVEETDPTQHLISTPYIYMLICLSIMYIYTLYRYTYVYLYIYIYIYI
jgi:hypothetical protein